MLEVLVAFALLAYADALIPAPRQTHPSSSWRTLSSQRHQDVLMSGKGFGAKGSGRMSDGVSKGGTSSASGQSFEGILRQFEEQKIRSEALSQGPCVFEPREKVVFNHLQMAEYCASLAAGKLVATTSVDEKGAVESSPLAASELRPVTLNALASNLGRVAKGCALRVTTLAPAHQMVAIQVPVEDEEGTVVNLSLYNASGGRRRSAAELLKLYPPGTRLLIKDPYLKVFTSGSPGIRVDHATNVVIEEQRDGAGQTSAAALKEEGNSCFAKKDWEGALQAYEKALGLDPAEDLMVALQSNLAKVYLKLQQPLKALRAAEAVLALRPEHVKARFRLGVAESTLGRHESAVRRLEGLQGLVTPSALEAALARARRRLAESKGQVRGPPLLDRLEKGDVANFIGPVEIREAADGRGRGLFTTAAVRQGEPLLVERALAVAVEGQGLATLALESSTGGKWDACSSESQEAVMQMVLHKAMASPVENARALALYDGTPASSQAAPPLELYLTDAPNPQLYEDLAPCSVDRTRRVVKYNVFAYEEASAGRGQGAKGSGLWALASFMNHARRPTTARTTVGQYMVVVASRDLCQGEEVTTTYIQESKGAQGGKTRAERLRSWGIKKED